jgi:hypothetical protein
MGHGTSDTQLRFKGLSSEYRPRRPEETVLYQAVAKNYRTFEAFTEYEGKRIPRHVSQEFQAFLKCGILAHGFLRLSCTDCKKEKVVAFSCKKRGFCSSCGGRRMAESAAHLVDEVFPKVGIRQWVLSFPMPVRFILAKNPKIQAKCLTIVHRAITHFIRKKAKKKGFKARLHPGAVTLIQRFGGSLNLNVHYHMLFLEGGYYQTESSLQQGPKFWWVDAPTDAEIQAMVSTLAIRVIRCLKRNGYFRDDVDGALPDEEMSQEELFSGLQAASVRSKIALGERQGQRVRRLGSVGPGDFHPELKGPLCAMAAGFSLHAEVYCAPGERDKLEKLCRYIARPAVSEERLKQLPSGDIVLKLKTKYSDGTSHLLFSGLEFIETLRTGVRKAGSPVDCPVAGCGGKENAALVPPPRIHLTRFFGCLAPHAKLRSLIVPKKVEPQTPAAAASVETSEKSKRSKRKSWAELLARVFDIDVKKCSHCGGELKIIAAIIEVGAIRKILGHLGLPDKPPDIAPARLPTQLSFA